jgi:hypothetical protein
MALKMVNVVGTADFRRSARPATAQAKEKKAKWPQPSAIVSDIHFAATIQLPSVGLFKMRFNSSAGMATPVV